MKLNARCDIDRFHKITKVVYDARIPGGTMWAYLCPECFKGVGAKTGLGRGQKFVCNPAGDWTKVEG